MTWQFIPESPASRKIRELVEPVCTACGVDLYLVEVLGGGRNRAVVRVLIDAIDGVDIADCVKVSRQLSAVLDVENPIHGAFQLEVSSPGLDRPLRHLDDARRIVGQKVRLETKEPVHNRRRFVGTLTAVEIDALVVEADHREFRVPVAAVKKALRIYDFGPIGRAK